MVGSRFSRHRAVLFALLGVVLVSVCGELPAAASTRGAAGTGDTPVNTIVAESEHAGGAVPADGEQPSASAPHAPRCVYVPMGSSITADMLIFTPTAERSAVLRTLALSPLDPPSTSRYAEYCDGQLSLYARWFPDGAADPPPPTVDALWPSAYDRMVERLPPPVPALSPPVEVGSFVNFGLWLAIEEPSAVAARSQAGPVWAEVTATLDRTTWDMGDGTIVECLGIGDPIIDLNTNAQSPVCGHTYTYPSMSAVSGTGRPAYWVTVTAHWSVRLVGSDGRDVALEPVATNHSFDYVVAEIHTVGVPAD